MYRVAGAAKAGMYRVAGTVTAGMFRAVGAKTQYGGAGLVLGVPKSISVPRISECLRCFTSHRRAIGARAQLQDHSGR